MSNYRGGWCFRQPCSEDSSSDGSLLAPTPQPQFGKVGPLNVFGPYRETDGMGDQARSRSTLAHYRNADGDDYLFLTGSTKTGENLTTNIAPSLVRLQIVSERLQPAHLQLNRTHESLVFQNPGSPVVSSNGHRNAIVWILDTNKPRSASLFGPDAPQPVLYAVDAETMGLIWRSKPGELQPGGKYNEATVADGQVFVGTDRIQGIRARVPSSVNHPACTLGQPGYCQFRYRQTRLVRVARYTQNAAAVVTTVSQAAAASQQQLAQLPVGRIVENLLYGSMQSQALGLSEAQMSQIALFLTAPQ